MLFDIGDKVRILRGTNSGCTGVVASTNRSNTSYPYGINLDERTYCTYGTQEKWSNGNSDICEGDDLELISSTRKNNGIVKFMSSLVEKLKLMGMGEPEKTFREMGIQDEKGNRTAEGQELYNNWRFEKDKLDFNKEVVEPLKAELEKEKADCKK